MQKFQNLSPFKLSSLLRLEKDPQKALDLFLTPNSPNPNSKPFPYSALSYDLILTKLGKARMFTEIEIIIDKLRNERRIIPEEVIFCNIITYYGRARLPHKALQVFDEIPSFRCRRTIKSVNTLLNSLLMCGKFARMRELVSGVEQYAIPDACTYNILIKSCCMNNDLGKAFKVFDEMPKKGIKPNVVTYGTLIHGLCANLEIDEAFRLKRKMERKFGLIPNAHIYVVLIKCLCKIGKLDSAIELKNKMLKKQKVVGLDPAVYSTLISAFFKGGRQAQIPELLDEMKRNGCKPDTVMYNAVIHGFCREMDIDSAFRALSEMEIVGCKPEVITYNVIIAGLCRAGRVTEGYELLEDMPRRKCSPDVVTYRTVFDGLCDKKRFEDATGLLDEMIFVGYAHSCSSVSKFVDRLVGGKEMELWAYIVRLVKINSVDRCIWRLIVSLTCKGDDGGAGKLFDSLIKLRL